MVKTRVLLADDHPILRAGLALLINAQPDLEVTAEAGDGLEAVEKARRQQPDVVILDLSMPRLGGFEALRRIRHECPTCAVLVLTMHDDPAYSRSAIAAGALGYVTKNAADRELLVAIRTVRDGRPFVEQTRTRHGMTGRRHRAGGAGDVLSQRERQVLALLARGFTQREVADQANVSIKTVETYRARIAHKLGLRRRAELVRYALDTGLLQAGDTTS